MFREFFQNLNQITFPDTARRPLRTDVIQVADQVTTLDPVVETAEVQGMINRHNAQLSPFARPLEISRTVFFTGYLVSPADTAKLLDLVKVPPNLAESEIRYLANSILIAPRPADPNLLDQTGPTGSKQTWQVTGFSFFQSSIWAIRVAPVPPTSRVYVHNRTPVLVLATYKNTKPELANSIQIWQPVPADKQYVLQTEVGEKVQLRIEAAPAENDHGNILDRGGIKRRHSPGLVRNIPSGEENPRKFTHTVANGKSSNHHRYTKGAGPGPSSGRAVATQNRSTRVNGAGNGRANRQRGAKGNYRSLDDIGANAVQYGNHRVEPSFDESHPGHGSDPNASGLDGSGGLPYGQ